MLEVVAIQKVFSGLARTIPSQNSNTSARPGKTPSQELSYRSQFFPFSSPILPIVLRMMPLRAIQLGLI